MGFHEVLYPIALSYDTTAGIKYDTAIVDIDGRYEERIQRDPTGRRTYNGKSGLTSYDKCTLVMDFHTCRRGRAYGFRFRDAMNFTTAPNHRDAPTNLDQSLGIGDGVTTTFQLVNRYTSGPVTEVRVIRKPIAGTVLVAGNGFGLTDGVDFTANTTNGVVTFTMAPVLGVVLTAGCMFDTPVRFDNDELVISLSMFDSGAIPDIPLIEDLNDAVTDDDGWAGGAKSFGAISADTAVTELDSRFLVFVPMAAGKSVILPNPAALAPGGPKFFIGNDSVTLSLLLKDHLGNLVVTITPQGIVQVLLGPDAAGVRKWYACPP